MQCSHGKCKGRSSYVQGAEVLSLPAGGAVRAAGAAPRGDAAAGKMLRRGEDAAAKKRLCRGEDAGPRADAGQPVEWHILAVMQGPARDRRRTPKLTLLVDYGEVISRPQPVGTLERMAELTELDEATFLRGYWQHRPSYDLGSSSRDYWSAILDRTVASDDPVLAELVAQDLAGWTRLNRHTLDVLEDVHRGGASLSLLSNAPADLAETIEADQAFAMFDHLIFSARLGVAKPDAAAFQAALDTMGASAADVTFIDDRPDNTAAAAALGIDVIAFTTASRLREELDLRLKR